jgi:hypothetical protein
MTQELLLSTPPGDWVVDLAIVFNWYDGPREGICKLAAPDCEFLFKLLAERPTDEALDDRVFSASPLPVGALSRVTDALGFAVAPSRPVWVPIWHSDVEGQLAAADKAIEDAIGPAPHAQIVMKTKDFERFTGVWQVEDPATVKDWFTFLSSCGEVTKTH